MQQILNSVQASFSSLTQVEDNSSNNNQFDAQAYKAIMLLFTQHRQPHDKANEIRQAISGLSTESKKAMLEFTCDGLDQFMFVCKSSSFVNIATYQNWRGFFIELMKDQFNADTASSYSTGYHWFSRDLINFQFKHTKHFSKQETEELLVELIRLRLLRPQDIIVILCCIESKEQRYAVLKLLEINNQHLPKDALISGIKKLIDEEVTQINKEYNGYSRFNKLLYQERNFSNSYQAMYEFFTSKCTEALIDCIEHQSMPLDDKLALSNELVHFKINMEGFSVSGSIFDTTLQLNILDLSLFTDTALASLLKTLAEAIQQQASHEKTNEWFMLLAKPFHQKLLAIRDDRRNTEQPLVRSRMIPITLAALIEHMPAELLIEKIDDDDCLLELILTEKIHLPRNDIDAIEQQLEDKHFNFNDEQVPQSIKCAWAFAELLYQRVSYSTFICFIQTHITALSTQDTDRSECYLEHLFKQLCQGESSHPHTRYMELSKLIQACQNHLEQLTMTTLAECLEHAIDKQDEFTTLYILAVINENGYSLPVNQISRALALPELNNSANTINRSTSFLPFNCVHVIRDFMTLRDTKIQNAERRPSSTVLSDSGYSFLDEFTADPADLSDADQDVASASYASYTSS